MRYKIIIGICSVILLSCESKLKEIPSIEPVKVITDQVIELNDSTLEVVSKILSIGEGIIEYGHQFGISPIDFSTTTRKGKSEQIITFRDTIKRISPGTSYYIRAYAKDRNRQVFSNPISFVIEIENACPFS